MMIVCIGIITAIPELATWLPDVLVGVTRK